MADDNIYEISCKLNGNSDWRNLIASLLSQGALDAFITPASHPILTVLCKENKLSNIEDFLLVNGFQSIHRKHMSRNTLDRTIDTIDTEYGTVHRKNAFGQGVSRSKLEFDDLKKISQENNIPLIQLKQNLK